MYRGMKTTTTASHSNEEPTMNTMTGLIKNESIGTRSYYAYITATDGNTLLGGVVLEHSSRFASWEQAQSWLLQAVETNHADGRPVDESGILSSSKAPEIAQD
jgi:hypothetical protein